MIAKSSLGRANAGYKEVYLLREERLDEGAINYLCRIDPGRVKELLGTRRILGRRRGVSCNKLPSPPGVETRPKKNHLGKTKIINIQNYSEGQSSRGRWERFSSFKWSQQAVIDLESSE